MRIKLYKQSIVLIQLCTFNNIMINSSKIIFVLLFMNSVQFKYTNCIKAFKFFLNLKLNLLPMCE